MRAAHEKQFMLFSLTEVKGQFRCATLQSSKGNIAESDSVNH